MKICGVYGCEERGVKVHRFPNPKKDFERFKIWLDACKNPKLYQLPAEKVHISHFVCHKHFKSTDVSRNDVVFRKSFPTLYLPGSENVSKKEENTSTGNESITDSTQKANLPVLNESESRSTNQTSSHCSDKENSHKLKKGGSEALDLEPQEPVRKKKRTDYVFFSKPLNEDENIQCEQQTQGNNDIKDSVVVESDINDNQKLEVINKHFHGICRTCMKFVDNEDYFEFSISDEEDGLRQRLLFAFSIDLYQYDDNGIVCKSCLKRIEDAYIFRRRLCFIQTAFKKHFMTTQEKPKVTDIYKSNKNALEEYEKEITSKVGEAKGEIVQEELNNVEISYLEEKLDGNQISSEENIDISIEDILKQQETVKLQLQESVSKLKLIKEKKSSVSVYSSICEFCGLCFSDLKTYYRHKASCSIMSTNQSINEEGTVVQRIEKSNVVKEIHLAETETL